MAAKNDKKKYQKELEEIKKMRDLDAIMKRADIENALLTAPSSETESVSDTRIDSMLEDLSLGKSKEQSLDRIEDLTTRNRYKASRNAGTKRHGSKAKAAKPQKPSKHKTIKKRGKKR